MGRVLPPYPRTKCKYCSESISTNAIARHEALCAKSSDKDRAKRIQMRKWAANKPDRRAVAKYRRGGPYRKRISTLPALLSVNGGHGRKLTVTLSLPMSVLMQLLPSINLERVEVI